MPQFDNLDTVSGEVRITSFHLLIAPQKGVSQSSIEKLDIDEV
jgi:hypothetical protein